MTERRILVVAYPHQPNSMFEEAMVALLPPPGWTIARFQTIEDIFATARAAWQSGTVDVMQLDIFAHGRPGAFGVDQLRLFDCFAGTCALRGVEQYLHPNAVIRFLGCEVAAAEIRPGGWSFDPLKGLEWVSMQLGGLRVEAPSVAISAASFDATGFGQPPSGVMVAAQRNPTP